jgi:IS5 family transposase
MAHRDWGQLGFADHMVMRRGRRNELLTRLAELIDRIALGRIVAVVQDSPHGAPAYPPLAMLEALLLQQWYGLSDLALEEGLWDRLSIQAFCGLPLGETAPDYSTIIRFRNALRKDDLDQRVFGEVHRQFNRRGRVPRNGTLIDASQVPMAVSPPKKPKSRCRRARTARRRAGWSKAHAISRRNGPIRAASAILATRRMLGSTKARRSSAGSS